MNVPTVLYVENDPVALLMYQKRLEREGFHVETAPDGMEALESITRHTPDVLMLDLVLSSFSGADVLRFVLASPDLKDLPIVIFSNAPKTEIPEEVTLNGYIKFVSKLDCPFEKLLGTIREVLANSHGDAPASQGGLAVASAAPSAAQPAPDTVEQPRPGSATGDGGLAMASSAPSAPQPAPDAVQQPRPGPVTPPLAGAPARESAASEPSAPAPVEIGKLRHYCFSFIKAPASALGLDHLAKLRQSVQLLDQQAEKASNAPLALLTKAFSAVLIDVAARPAHATPAVLQTIAQAMDCLDHLTQNGLAEAAQPWRKPVVLAVDDDPVCNHVMAWVLKRAGFEGDCVLKPQAALDLVSAKHYDAALLDVDMPGMSGFELCEKLRRLPQCKATPVIFITAHNNFDNRTRSVLSGAHDFVAKPVEPFCLVLKIIVLLIKQRFQLRDTPPAAKLNMAPVASSAPAPAASPKREEAQPAAPVVPPSPPPVLEQPAVAPTVPPSPPLVLKQPAAAPIAPPSPPLVLKQPAAAPIVPPSPPPVPKQPSLDADRETHSSQDEKPAAGVPVAAPASDSLVVETSHEPSAPADKLATDAPSEKPLLEITKQNSQVMQKGQNQSFDKIVSEVAKILFGEENVTEINLRLVRMALEAAKVHELVKAQGEL